MPLPPLCDLYRDPDSSPEKDLPYPNRSYVPQEEKRFLGKFLWIGAFLFVLFIMFLVYVFRLPLLAAGGALLVYESELKPCDVAVVLTGGGITRLERAIELLQTGYAPKILLTLPDPLPEGVPYYDLFNTEKVMCQALLDYRKIPPEKIAWSQTPYNSTYAEAIFLRGWMEQNQCKSAIVVAGYFQTRRAKWAMERAFRGGAFDIRIAAASGELHSETDWWTNEEGVVMVENEYLKNIYYRIKGLIGNP
jgi:uncharacterized SAM-binding protein YcdF (DUF218 family)